MHLNTRMTRFPTPWCRQEAELQPSCSSGKSPAACTPRRKNGGVEVECKQICKSKKIKEKECCIRTYASTTEVQHGPISYGSARDKKEVEERLYIDLLSAITTPFPQRGGTALLV